MTRLPDDTAPSPFAHHTICRCTASRSSRADAPYVAAIDTDAWTADVVEWPGDESIDVASAVGANVVTQSSLAIRGYDTLLAFTLIGEPEKMTNVWLGTIESPLGAVFYDHLSGIDEPPDVAERRSVSEQKPDPLRFGPSA